MAKAKPRRGKKKGIGKRIALGFVILCLVLGLVGMGAFALLYSRTDLPDPNADFQTNTTFLYYADGETQLGSLAVQNRETLPVDQIPQVMKDAVIAAEDRSFWENPGFSALGIARAAWSIATGGEVQGGSTITQQYIKILYLDSERTMSRKARELMLAIKMGKELPKEEILAGYLNTIYFGRGAYGIQAASKSYFLKPAKDLTIAEAAALGAILNNPAGFNPSAGEEARARLLARYQYVLDGMLEMGFITQAQHDAEHDQLPEFPEVPKSDRYGGTKGYLIKMAEAELERIGIPEAQVQGGGLRITTTIDKRLQDEAVKVAQAYTKEATENGREGATDGDLHVALASVDTATGALKAMYGGPNYVEYPRNWATTPRAAASTFKTWGVVAALREGFSLDTRLNGNTFTPRGDTKPIRNQASRDYGTVTLRRALADSINTAFVDLTEQLDGGPQAIEAAANDAGEPTGPGWDLHSRFALGFAEVSPVNVANAYATLANEGRRNAAHIVAKVTDAQGNVLYEAAPANEQTIEPEIAAVTVDALTSVVDEGTGSKASALGRPVAGKTGTNGIDDTITSAWFVGMTKQLSTAVMYVVGDGGTGDLVPYRQPGDRTFYGSGYPLRTWVDFMTVATDGMPVEDFAEAPELEPSKEPREERSEQPTQEPTSEEPQPTEEPSSDATSEPPSPEPAPTTTEPAPEPTTTEPDPEPTTSEPDPEPTTTPPEPTQKPEPTTQAPKPSASQLPPGNGGGDTGANG